MNSVRPLSTQHHVKNWYFLRIEHFRTLTCNKCIVCCAKHNELFKLARHPNPRRHWENFLYSSPIQIQTHTTKWNSVLFCIFLHLFAYYWVAYDKNDCAMNIYLYVSVCLFLFIQFECSLFCKRLFRIEIKKKTNTEVSHKFCILRKIHRQDNRRKNESKRSKKKTVTTEQVMRCTRNVFVYGRFRKSPLPIPRSSMGWSFPFSCTWMPHNRMRNDNGMTGGGGTGIAIGTPHFGTWKAWESNNWIGHLDIIFKTKIMTTQQCNPGLCSNKMLRF